MKLQPDRAAVPTLTSHGPGWVAIDGTRVTHSVLLSVAGPHQAWAAPRFEDLTADHFAQLAGLDVEVVIFGSGRKIRFPHPRWLAPLAARRIGLETMDTPAACRTYNILAQEGRRVVGALLLEAN